MRVLIAAVVLTVSSVVVSAQTVESTIDLSALGWGTIDVLEPVETDGDLATREWLIRSMEINQYRVIAERPSGLCAGAWFDPRTKPFSAISVKRVGLLHKILVRDGTLVTVKALLTPSC